MSCEKYKLQLALYAGGDLPQEECAELEKHLESCTTCQTELNDLQSSQKLIVQLKTQNHEEEVPNDLIDSLSKSVVEIQDRNSNKLRARNLYIISAVAAGILIAAIFISGLFSADSERITWNEIESRFSGCFEGPYTLKDFSAPDKPGVFAVMQKTSVDSENETFELLYCNQSHSLESLQAYPWLNQRLRAMSNGELYVTICIEADLSRLDRIKIAKDLSKDLKKLITVNQGV